MFNVRFYSEFESGEAKTMQLEEFWVKHIYKRRSFFIFSEKYIYIFIILALLLLLVCSANDIILVYILQVITN